MRFSSPCLTSVWSMPGPAPVDMEGGLTLSWAEFHPPKLWLLLPACGSSPRRWPHGALQAGPATPLALSPLCNSVASFLPPCLSLSLSSRLLPSAAPGEHRLTDGLARRSLSRRPPSVEQCGALAAGPGPPPAPSHPFLPRGRAEADL